VGLIIVNFRIYVASDVRSQLSGTRRTEGTSEIVDLVEWYQKGCEQRDISWEVARVFVCHFSFSNGEFNGVTS